MLNIKPTLLTILLIFISIEIAFAQSFDIYCEKPGKLKKQFKKVDLTSVKDLKILGSLNEKDFDYLQQFTNLETLDLSKANIPQMISVCSLSRLSILKVASDCEISIRDGQCLDELHVIDGHKVSLKNGRLYNDIITAIKLYQYKGIDYNYGVNSAYTYYMEYNRICFNLRLEKSNITIITPESVKNHPILKYFYDINAFANYVFSDSNIEEIQIPDKVKVLNESCFWGCKRLKKIIINGKIGSVGRSCFRDCISLKEVNVHADVIGSDLFSGCTSLEKVIIVADKELGNANFYNCPVKDITIGAPVIKKLYKDHIDRLNILDGVKTLEFEGYTEIKDTLVLPVSLVECSTDGYNRVYVDVLVIENKTLKINGNVMANKTIVPEGSYQYYKDAGLKNIIENGIRPSYKFKIDQPGTILSYLPVNDMHKVDSLTISGVLYEYDLGIIKKCHNLRYLDLHNAFVIKSPERYEQEKNSLTNFLTQAAALCLDIQSYIATGNSLGAFDYIEASIDKEYNKRFNNDFYLPDGLMKNHTNIETVILPIYTTKIPEDAFSGCEKLKNIIIPSALEEIGSGAFSNCKSLENIIIPKCDYIRKNVFNNCSSLKNIIFKGKVKEIPLVYNCESLQTLRFPDGLEKFGGIESCPNVKDIYFPSTIKIISDIDNGSSELNLHFYNMKAPEVWRIKRSKMNIIIPKGSITSYYRCFSEGCNYIEE